MTYMYVHECILQYIEKLKLKSVALLMKGFIRYRYKQASVQGYLTHFLGSSRVLGFIYNDHARYMYLHMILCMLYSVVRPD